MMKFKRWKKMIVMLMVATMFLQSVVVYADDTMPSEPKTKVEEEQNNNVESNDKSTTSQTPSDDSGNAETPAAQDGKDDADNPVDPSGKDANNDKDEASKDENENKDNLPSNNGGSLEDKGGDDAGKLEDENIDKDGNEDQEGSTGLVNGSEEKTEYATQDDLDAAYKAVGDVDPTGDDMKAFLAAMDAYLAVYDRLSPEDREARRGEYEYVKAYRDEVAAGMPDEEIEMLARTYKCTATFKIKYSGGTKNGKTETVGSRVVKQWSSTSIAPKYTPTASDFSVDSNYTLISIPGETQCKNGTITLTAQAQAKAPSIDFNKWYTTKPAQSDSYAVVKVYGTTTTYGTENQAILNGPRYGSEWYKGVAFSGYNGQNNTSFTIPQASELFTIADGWKLKYVSVAGNSAGNKQPGDSVLMSLSGISLVYYFEKTTYTYTLDYDGNKPSGVTDNVTDIPDQQKLENTTATTWSPVVSSNEPKLAGYTFEGWYLNAGGTGTRYVGGNTVSGYSTSATSKTLYAKWTPIDYTITYTDGVEDQEVFKDKVYNNQHYGDTTPTYTAPATYTDKNGKTYEFDGWTPGVAETVTGTQIYTAKWKEKINTLKPLTVTKTVDGNKTEFKVGDEITYEIIVSNTNSKTVFVEITDELSDMFGFVAAGDGGENKNGTVTWTNTEVPSNGSKTVSLTVKAVKAGKVTNSATVTWPDGGSAEGEAPEVTITGDSRPNLTVTKSVAGGNSKPFHTGDLVEYQIVVKNNGTAAAENVVVADALNSRLTFVKWGLGSKLDNETKPENNSYSLGRIEPGASVTLKILARVRKDIFSAGPQNVTIWNTATVDYTGKPDNENPSGRVDITVEPQEKLIPVVIKKGFKAVDATKDKTPTVNDIPENFYFDYSYTDRDNTVKSGRLELSAAAKAEEKMIYSWNPLYVKMMEGDPCVEITLTEHNYMINDNKGDFVWKNAHYAGSTTTTDTGVVKVRYTASTDSKSAQQSYVYNNYISENQDVSSPTIKDLGISKTADKSSAEIREQVKYTVTVTNSAEKAATVTVTDTLPDGLKFISAGNGGTNNNGTVTWTNVSVPAKKNGVDGKIDLIVTAEVTKAGSIRNTAVVKLGDDTKTTEKTVIGVDPDAPVSIIKVAKNSSAKADDLVTYTVTITNKTDKQQVVTFKDDMAGGKLVLGNGTTQSFHYTGSDVVGGVSGSFTSTGATFTLAAKKGASLTVEYTARVAANATGTVINTATANVSGKDYTDTADVTVKGSDDDNGAGIEVEKTLKSINGDETKTTAKAGDKIVWNIKVTNLSNVEKTVTLTEKLKGAVLSKDEVVLEAGKSETVTATYTVPANAVPGSKLKNVVVAETDKPDEKKEGTDESVEIVDPDAPVEIEKTVNKSEAAAGELMTYKVTITNKTDKQQKVTFKDDMAGGKLVLENGTTLSIQHNGSDIVGGISGSFTEVGTEFTLAARKGAKITFEYTARVAADAAGKLTNTATATVDGKDYIATADTTVKNPVSNPKLTGITKALEGTAPAGVERGESVTLTYKITVTGEEGAKYEVTDADVTVVSGNLEGTLDSTGKAEITVTKTVTAAEAGTLEVVNTAYVKPGDGTDPVDPVDPEEGHPSNEVKTEIEVTEPDNPTPTPDPTPTPTPGGGDDPTPTPPGGGGGGTGGGGGGTLDPTPTPPIPEITPLIPEIIPAGGPTTPVVPTVTPVPATPAVPTPTAALVSPTPEAVALADEAIPLAAGEEKEQPEPIAVDEEKTPLAGGKGAAWALINFALMNLAIFESVMLLIGYFVKTKNDEEEEKRKLKKKGIFRVISLPIAIISLIVFILTEDITLPTAFVDKYTIVMLIIAIVQTVMVALSNKKYEDEEEA